MAVVRPVSASRPGKQSADSDLRILRDPVFQTLTQERRRFAWILSALILIVYLGFIFLVAFTPGLMGTRIGDGPTSLGVVLGLAVIVFAFLLTGVYVMRANSRFDDLTRELKARQPR